jgi:hypothetical protein
MFSASKVASSGRDIHQVWSPDARIGTLSARCGLFQTAHFREVDLRSCGNEFVFLSQTDW